MKLFYTPLFNTYQNNVGELKINFSLPNREHVVNVAVEHRIANSGQPFVNGLYMKKESMVLTSLPQLEMVELRFKSLGRGLIGRLQIVVPVLQKLLNRNN